MISIRARHKCLFRLHHIPAFFFTYIFMSVYIYIYSILYLNVFTFPVILIPQVASYQFDE